jgi:hypothetical protein
MLSKVGIDERDDHGDVDARDDGRVYPAVSGSSR